MGIDNRDYMQNKRSPDRFSPSSWSMVSRLLVINVVIHLLLNTVFDPYPEIINNLALSRSGLASGKIFQLITYQFVHGSHLHLIFNMIGLYFLGKMAQQLLGGRSVLWIYLLGGMMGGIAEILFGLATGVGSIIVGASGSVMALLLAVATLIPKQSIYLLLFFVIPIKMTMRKLATILVAINVVTLLFQLGGGASSTGTKIAVFGHFGGMLLGWLYIKYILPFAKRRGKDRRRSDSMKNRFGIRVIKDAEVTDATGDTFSSSRENKKPFVSADVDAILDKISAEGMQSLTPKERKVLERSSKKLGRRIDPQ